MLKKLLFGSFICLVLLSLSYSDLIMPGYKPVVGCYKVINLNNFSNYVFVLVEYYPGNSKPIGFKLINESGCYCKGYKFNYCQIYAIKKQIFDKLSKNPGTLLYYLNNFSKSEKFKVLYEEVPGKSDIKGIKGIIKILFVDDKEVKLEIKKEYIYNHNQNNTTNFSENNSTNDTLSKEIDRKEDFGSMLIWISIISFVVIILIILLKKMKR